MNQLNGDGFRISHASAPEPVASYATEDHNGTAAYPGNTVVSSLGERFRIAWERYC